MLLPVLAAQTPQNNSDFSNSQYITDSNRTEASALTISLNVSNILNRQYSDINKSFVIFVVCLSILKFIDSIMLVTKSTN